MRDTLNALSSMKSQPWTAWVFREIIWAAP